jgi:hypothetical protein
MNKSNVDDRNRMSTYYFRFTQKLRNKNSKKRQKLYISAGFSHFN